MQKSKVQKFNKKYLSALVVSCIATMAVAQPTASSYGVAEVKVNDGEPEAVPVYEPGVYEQEQPEPELEPVQDEIVETTDGCCSNAGGIIGGLLQAGLLLTGFINDDDNEGDLAKLEDMIAPPLEYGGLQLFPGAIQPNQISSFNPLIESGVSGLLSIPSSGIPSSVIPSSLASLPLKGSSLISSIPLLAVSGLPSALIKGTEALSSSSSVASSLPSVSSAPISVPLGALTLSSSLAPLSLSLSPLSSIPGSLSVVSAIPASLSSLPSLSALLPLGLPSSGSALLSSSIPALLPSVSSVPASSSVLSNALSSVPFSSSSTISVLASSVPLSSFLSALPSLSMSVPALLSSSGASVPSLLVSSSFPSLSSASVFGVSGSSSLVSGSSTSISVVGIPSVISGSSSVLTAFSSLSSSTSGLLSLPLASSLGSSALVSSVISLSGLMLSSLPAASLSSSMPAALSSGLSAAISSSVTLPLSSISLSGLPSSSAGVSSASLGTVSLLSSIPTSSLAPLVSLSSVPSSILSSSALINGSSSVALSTSGVFGSLSSPSSIPASSSAPVLVPSSLPSLASSSLVPSSIAKGSSAALSASMGSSFLSGSLGIHSAIGAVSSSLMGLSSLPASLSSVPSVLPAISTFPSLASSIGSAVSLAALPSSLLVSGSFTASLASSSSSSVSVLSAVPSTSSSLGLSSLLSSLAPSLSSLAPLSGILSVPSSLGSVVSTSSAAVVSSVAGSSSLSSLPSLVPASSLGSSSSLTSSLPALSGLSASLSSSVGVSSSIASLLLSLPSSLSIPSSPPSSSGVSSSVSYLSSGLSLSSSVPLSSLPLSSGSLALSSLLPLSVPALPASLAGSSSLVGSSSGVAGSVSASASAPLSSSSVLSPLSSSSGVPSAASGSVSISSGASLSLPVAPSLVSSSVNSSLALSSSSLASSSLVPSIAPLSSSLVPASSLIPSSALSSSGPISSSMGSLAPFKSSSAALSLTSSISSAAVPVGSGLSSVSSGLPSSSSLGSSSSSLGAPLSSSSAPVVMSSYAPIISSAGGAISWRLSYPSLSTWKYGFHKYNFNVKSDDFEFRNLVTFGDSLSDTGSFGRGSVYMANGNPYVFYNSYLSLALSGKVVTPARVATQAGSCHEICGANYALSGAVLRSDVFDPMSWIIPRDSLTEQVNRYLSRNGGMASKDDAFVIWGGGNDVTADIQYALLNPIAWKPILSGAREGQPYLNSKSDVPAMLAQKLINHGAEGPLLILNLPSSALTSFTGVLLESTMDTGVLTGGTPFDVFNLGGWLMKAQDDYLRNPANRVGDLAAGNGIKYFRENNVNAIQHRYPFVPRALIEAYFDTVFNAQNNVVSWFNQAVDNKVKTVAGGNVVQLDIDGLFKEVINNPLDYGIDEVLVPECTIGKVAPACDEGDAHYHGNDGRRYMYTDWHHPSALMHRIVAEYVIATLNAPAYVTGLNRSLETGAKSRQDYLLSELTRINARPYEGQGQSYVFGGYSGGYSKQSRSLNNSGIVYNGFNIGYGYRPVEGLDVGLMGSLGISKIKPHRTLKYDQQDLVLTGFAQYTAGPWWINGMLSGGKTKFGNIERSIPLGEHTRVEKSETDGKTFGGRVETGYEVLLGDTWVLAPMVAYTKYRYEVDAFEEEGSSSTAMKFGKQKRDKEYVTAGLRISDDCPDDSAFVRGSVDITANKSLNEDNKDNKNKLIGQGGLKRYSTSFSREANRLVKDADIWFEIKPTVQFKVDKNSRVTTSVNYAIDKNKSKSKNLSYSVGYRYEF